MHNPERLPDYIIIGTMKSGTSSLYIWLAQQPECSPAKAKEINFFSYADCWRRGLDWYRGFFSEVPEGTLVGEASTSYTKPKWEEAAAERMAATVPDVRIIYLLRDPIERLRSQYRHEVRRSRETRSLVDALADPTNSYVPLSLYHQRLLPYLRLFPREQILVVRMEDLVSDEATGWTSVLGHLGLPPRPPPGTAHNVTVEKAQFTRPLLWLWTSGYERRLRRWMPRPVRRLARTVLAASAPSRPAQTESSDMEISTHVTEPIWRDIARLEDWLGVREPLWEHPVGDGGS